jgi:hypothetical protein
VLIGLDRLGHLRKLVGTETFHETESAGQRTQSAEATAAAEAPSDSDLAWLFPKTADDVDETSDDSLPEPAADEAAEEAIDGQSDESEGEAAAESTPAWAVGARSATDHVRLFMEIVMGELRRPDHPRLVELEPGRWWLRDEADLDKARPPLSDRLEWAIFGLLSTSSGISEDAFFERVSRMYRGFDTPDEEMVRAILDSYRDPASPPARLDTRDDLQRRHAEHGMMVGMLVEYGHRLGMRAWAGPREQRRAYRDSTVGDLLTEEEQRVYLPLISAGDPVALENTDCIWYVRGKATFLFEVEWTAIIAEPLTRGRRITTDDKIVRFLVVPDERIELVRLKLSRSPLLRQALQDDNWHILKWDHVRRLHAQEDASLEQLAPLIGLDPEAERQGEQLALFG